jgi:hypothetical protein
MDYISIKQHCEEGKILSSKLVDNHLVNHCSKRESLDKVLVSRFSLYRNIINQFPENYQFFIAAQYIAFRLFHKNGFISSYLTQQLINFPDEEVQWLQFQSKNPWRFSFFTIKETPHREFFILKDELIQEEFLCYSPGIQDLTDKRCTFRMIFLLVSFNGLCWETYGPLCYLKSMLPEDLLFFSRQIKPDIDFVNEIPELIDKDPFPFMMLWRGGEFPLSTHGDDLIIFNKSEYHEENFEPENLGDNFTVIKKYPVFKMDLNNWNSHPHFSHCFYHAKKKRLILMAMTNKGYDALVKALSESGITLPEHPDIRATMTMILTAQEVFKTNFELSPYEKTFVEPIDPEKQLFLNKTNTFIRRFLEYQNKGKPCDIKSLAAEAGIDEFSAHQIVKQLKKSAGK